MIPRFLLVFILIIASAESRSTNYVDIIAQHPYICSIELNGMHICSGTIITYKHVITAANCVENRLPEKVKAGVTDIKHAGITSKVKEATIHPDYHTNKMEYDAAVLELKEPLPPIPKVISPIRLPYPKTAVPPISATELGWAEKRAPEHDLEEDKTLLRSVDLTVFPTSTCDTYRAIPLRSTMFCAGIVTGKRESCTGDIGGPLIISDLLFGIASFGPRDCLSGIPSVYMNVPRITQWVNETVSHTLKWPKPIG